MSGPRITRKVTVEVSKKVTDSTNVSSSVVQPASSSSSSYNPRRSVFERLGPGAIDQRSKSHEGYPLDKCRNWLREGRCPYGNNCKFLHGPYTEPKTRTKSIRSIVQSGSKDRCEDSDEKQQLYRSKSLDSVDLDDEEVSRDLPKKKKRHKSEEGLSDTSPKKTTKTKKKHKDELEIEDEEGKPKRKRKAHKKRDPLSKLHSPINDEEDWSAKESLLKDYERQLKNAENWEEQGELDYERQLELERRRQDLQRQLALMDEEDAAGSTDELSGWKGSGKEGERKVPIVHSRLHPQPSVTPPDASQPIGTKKKKKKKLDLEGKVTKIKKEASPRKKDEAKRKVVIKGEEDSLTKKDVSVADERVKKVSAASSDDTDVSEDYQPEKETKKPVRSSAVRDRGPPEPHGSPLRSRATENIRSRVPEDTRQRVPEDTRSRVPEDTRSRVTDETRSRATEDTRSRAIEDTRSRVLEDTRSRVTEDTRSRVIEDTRSRATEDTRSRATEDSRSRATDDTRSRVSEDTRSRAIEDTRSRVPEDTRSRVLEDIRPRAIEDTRSRVPEDTRSRVPEDTRSRVSVDTRSRVQDETRSRVPEDIRSRVSEDTRLRVSEEPIRKRQMEDDYKHKRDELSSPSKFAKEKRRSEILDDAHPVRHAEDTGRPRKPRDPHYYPGPDDQGEDTRKVRSRVAARGRGSFASERQHLEDARPEDRGRRREGDDRVVALRGPRTPPPLVKPRREDERHYFDEGPVDIKRKRPARAPRSPPRDPGREESMYRKDMRGKPPEDLNLRGPRTPSDDDAPFSPTPYQAEASRSNRFSERERDLPRRERGPPGDHGDQRFPAERGGRGHIDAGDFDRRKPREEEIARGRRPPPRVEDYPRGRTQGDDYPKPPRGRDEGEFQVPREPRGANEELSRHREREKRDIDDHKLKYPDERTEEFAPARARPRGERDEAEFTRGRGREERDDDPRGRLPPRDLHRRSHDEVEPRDLRDERDRTRPDFLDSRSRERPDERGREPRYGGTTGPDHFRRPSPSQGPPRGRSPPHRYDDRRRPDDGFRAGLGNRDAPVGRGRGAGRGRGGYNPSYDNRAKGLDTRRRSPPPPPPPPPPPLPGPRSFQDRDRGPPRGRDLPIGRGRGYTEKGRPQSDRYRDTTAPWDRRAERDYPRDHRKPYEEPVARDRRPRDSSPPAGYRDPRPWDDRRVSPQRAGSLPLQERRTPYESDQDIRVVPEHLERRSIEGGAEDWEYEEEVNPDKPIRKRSRPAVLSSQVEPPFEAKKARGVSPGVIDAGPLIGDIPAVPGEPTRPKKTAIITKDGKKIKKKKIGKKNGKAVKAIVGADSVPEPQTLPVSVVVGKTVKGEKKLKKDKKLKEKGAKKKKKVAAAAVVKEIIPVEHALVEPIVPKDQAPVTVEQTAAPKIGKKRKQMPSVEGESLAGKDADKPKKKKKKKHQPEVVVQPWADLEDQEEQNQEDITTQEKKDTTIPEQNPDLEVAVKPEKSQDEMFSDWSDDDSPVGGDPWFDEGASPEVTKPKEDQSAAPASPAPPAPSFDDVYDPISDDEFEAMYTQSDDEEDGKDSKAVGVEDVDWSSLGISQQPDTEKEPVSHLQRFTPGHVFSRIGFSPTLAGPRLTRLVLDACAKAKQSESGKQETGLALSIPETGPKSIGAYVAAAAAKKREREALLGNLGPCRRALCARRDLAMRKQLGRSSKFGKVALFAASPSTPVDNELFQMSVALYRKESPPSGVSVVPSKFAALLTQA